MFLCDRGTLIKHWSLIRRFESWIYFEVYNIYFFSLSSLDCTCKSLDFKYVCLYQQLVLSQAQFSSEQIFSEDGTFQTKRKSFDTKFRLQSSPVRSPSIQIESKVP